MIVHSQLIQNQDEHSLYKGNKASPKPCTSMLCATPGEIFFPPSTFSYSLFHKIFHKNCLNASAAQIVTCPPPLVGRGQKFERRNGNKEGEELFSILDIFLLLPACLSI
jgi:hypothetical protein